MTSGVSETSIPRLSGMVLGWVETMLAGGHARIEQASLTA
jgi:hypothetical protein